MSNPVIELSPELREKLLLSLNDHPDEDVQQLLDKLRSDSLAAFRAFLASLGDITLADQALKASWWFIENVAEDDWRRDEIFFELRSLVRQAYAEKSSSEGKPLNYIRCECRRDDRSSEQTAT